MIIEISRVGIYLRRGREDIQNRYKNKGLYISRNGVDIRGTGIKGNSWRRETVSFEGGSKSASLPLSLSLALSLSLPHSLSLNCNQYGEYITLPPQPLHHNFPPTRYSFHNANLVRKMNQSRIKSFLRLILSNAKIVEFE